MAATGWPCVNVSITVATWRQSAGVWKHLNLTSFSPRWAIPPPPSSSSPHYPYTSSRSGCPLTSPCVILSLHSTSTCVLVGLITPSRRLFFTVIWFSLIAVGPVVSTIPQLMFGNTWIGLDRRLVPYNWSNWCVDNIRYAQNINNRLDTILIGLN